jgi:molecular chaperone DnaJ
MAQSRDLYDVLGVSRDAGPDEIKRAYRRLAREHHPDVNPDPTAEARFKEATAAYETLSDPVKRRQYDLFGVAGVGAGAPDVFPFGDMGDVFDVFFGGGFGGRRQRTRRPTRIRRGEDLFVALALSFDEAVFGAKREVEVDTLVECAVCQGTGCAPGTHPSRCARCGGTGEVQDVARSLFGTVMTSRTCATCSGTGQEIAVPCSACGGEGRQPSRRTLAVDVPAGVADGMELRVAGGGQEGRLGGGVGDLYVSLRVQPHPVFDRRGQDLVCAATVSITQAALGCELDVPMLEGDTERLKLEPGTQPGTVVRVRGRGVPNIGRRGRGDLFVTILVDVPTRLVREERQHLERLAELWGEPSGKDRSRQARLRKLPER